MQGGAWNIFDAFHQVDQHLFMVRSDRGEANATIADDNGRNAMVRRRGEAVVPSGLAVVMGVWIDETRSDEQTFGVDDFRGRGASKFSSRCHGFDLAIANSEVCASDGSASAVYEVGIADDEVGVHGLLRSAVSGASRAIVGPQRFRNVSDPGTSNNGATSGMRVMIFGATGALGRECAKQCIEAGHEVSVYLRSPEKLPGKIRKRVAVYQGDALDGDAVAHAIGDLASRNGQVSILFAIGIDKASPEDLCTTATRLIFESMRVHGLKRFVWCGGGSTLVAEDQITLGARFVDFFARTFMGLRHRDKLHQLELLAESQDLDWVGLRPLQMVSGPHRETYRIGFDQFSGMSRIHFADCAHGMIRMLSDDTWIRKAPIIQY